MFLTPQAREREMVRLQTLITKLMDEIAVAQRNIKDEVVLISENFYNPATLPARFFLCTVRV